MMQFKVMFLSQMFLVFFYIDQLILYASYFLS